MNKTKAELLKEIKSLKAKIRRLEKSFGVRLSTRKQKCQVPGEEGPSIYGVGE